MEYIVIVNL